MSEQQGQKTLKQTETQSFWLGVTSALAVIFALLLWGVIAGSVTFGDSGSNTKVAQDMAAEPTLPPAPAQEPSDEDITVEEVSEKDWIRGSEDAKVTIIEFSDIDCPFCSRHHDTMNQLLEKYDGDVNWVYRHLPLPQLHPEARAKAIAAECVGNLGGNDLFWAYLDGLFASSAPDELTAEAKKLGLNMAAFQACVDEERYADKVDADMADATAAGGNGTPHNIVVIDGEVTALRGAQPITEFSRVIDAALAAE